MHEPPQRPLLGAAPIVLVAAAFAGMDTGVRALAGALPAWLNLNARRAPAG